MRGPFLRPLSRRLGLCLALCSLSTLAYICLLGAQPRLQLTSSLNGLLDDTTGGDDEIVPNAVPGSGYGSAGALSSLGSNTGVGGGSGSLGAGVLIGSPRELVCDINGLQKIPCLRDRSEVYLPFSFLRKYFEVYGKLSQEPSGTPVFHWQHSYSKYSVPSQKYRANGPYLWFGNYNVAVRDRVKVISGIEGVPVSTQWNSSGHLYPTQIAQFGLSHFSKNLTGGSSPTRRLPLVTRGRFDENVEWRPASLPGSSISGVITPATDEDTGRPVLAFSGDAVEVHFKASPDLVIVQLDLFLGQNGSVTVHVQASGTTYSVHYILSDVLISSRGQDVFVGVGAARNAWRTLTRDVSIDLRKGMILQTGSTGRRASKTAAALVGKSVQILNIVFHGQGRLGSASLLTQAHDEYFFAACNYLVRQQDANGGWPISVGRTLVAPDVLVLTPPWYSAMAQGQAMSLLVRAYLVTRQQVYLQAALRALELFKKSSKDGGVLTKFADRFSWYEEYPTLKSSFVLNGFVYSLFGIYDVYKVSNDSVARALFLDGFTSLKHMLPLFDTGTGSVYDLRHFSIPSLAPNLARWDYHTTHISQLLYLNTIAQSNVLESTAQRWIDYLHGKRAPHN
ncbi:D-glucuronyl C5-epimerase-like isoform X2 [Varroa destructor]|uniref:heparosan-N-sulfate-glucuronate 5-epimerase n=1 Tax=Varroa destructor TaxID=109461 RepID=A0A7M7L1H7_VARDE|nr:D-glucuronyl C5-epimerase-like isoform X2 [Varroa destructor]